MEILKKNLEKLIERLSSKQRKGLRNRLNNLSSVYPFNECEYVISSLLGSGKITLDDYLKIRDEYIARNMYLYIFEISAPRGFGEQWAQGHLKELVPALIKPTKKLDKRNLIVTNGDLERKPIVWLFGHIMKPLQDSKQKAD